MKMYGGREQSWGCAPAHSVRHGQQDDHQGWGDQETRTGRDAEIGNGSQNKRKERQTVYELKEKLDTTTS